MYSLFLCRFGTKRNQSDTKGYPIKHWKSFLY